MVSSQTSGKFGHRSMEMSLDRSRGNHESLCYLGFRELHVETQYRAFPLAPRQPPKRLDDLGVALSMQEVGLRSVHREHGDDVVLSHNSKPSQPRPGEIERDRSEVARHVVGSLLSSHLPMEPIKGLLDDVLGRMDVAHHEEDQTDELPRMASIQALKLGLLG
jgi:hypothetical protein